MSETRSEPVEPIERTKYDPSASRGSAIATLVVVLALIAAAVTHFSLHLW